MVLNLKRPNVIFFFVEKIKYLGHIIDKDGRRPDPERAAAIKDIPAPHNIASLESFMGLANYYQIFISNMHDLRVPLNHFFKNTSPGFGQQNARSHLKRNDVWHISNPIQILIL